ncbi:MAG: SDR family NAD(P)-dependent oxidoreductase, partial [Rubrivivax sp.]
SSTAGVLGNVGQADYAAANAFLDAYAQQRNERVSRGQAQGRTLSVNWPLWAEGGMQVEEATRQAMWRNAGLAPLPTEAGVQALGQALALGGDQVVVLAGQVDQIRKLVLNRAVAKAALPESATTAIAKAITGETKPADLATADLRDQAIRYFTALLASGLKLPAHRIDASASLDQYGMDSVLAMELVSVLESTFGTVSKTLFFEYQSIEALAGFFLGAYPAQLKSWLRPEKTPQNTAAAAQAAREPQALVPVIGGRRQRFARTQQAQPMGPVSPGALDIAIIGISGSYPKARTLQAFWSNLLQGVNCISEVPAERWDHSRYFDEQRDQPGKTYAKWGGFIDGVDEFDPLFFNISPREALGMDPQERLFLQCVHAAMEDAGYTRETLCAKHQAHGLSGNVGVFAGVMWNEYQLYGAQSQMGEQGAALAGNVSSIANRVSYFCNFHGPSLAVDTMCSSSLTAIHLACQNILRGSCEVAIAGGVNVSVHPNKFLALAQGQFAASDGLCKSFGEGGDGYVPGEGVGAVLLKPLAKALEDGDHIHGVIKGSAINHGGKTNGYTVPNPVAQAQVIAQALKESGVPARAVSYIEAHGTGTSLGDPIEMAGLNKAFGAQTTDTGYCAIGSAKSNIGHCESASGIAGLSKVLLQMKHQTLVPSLHSQTLNPHIDFDNTPFVVQRELAPWHRPRVAIDGQEREWPRIAGLSSFGAGGANAHLIIEEYLAPEHRVVEVTAERPAVVVLSARSESQLKEQAVLLRDAIQANGLQQGDLADIAYTLQVGREALGVRLACVVDTLEALQDKLQRFSQGEDSIQDLYFGDVKRNKDALDAFRGDEDLSNAIESWILKGKLHKLIDLWVKGLSFDWRRLHGEATPRRISLPTYPFAREKYWAPSLKAELLPPEETPAIANVATPAAAPAAQKPISPVVQDHELMMFDEVWAEQVITAPTQPPALRTVLCFASRAETQQAVREAVAALDGQAAVVFMAHGEVDAQAFAQIKDTHAAVDLALYLWPLEDRALVGDATSVMEVLQALGHSQLPCKRLILAGRSATDLEQALLESWIGFERSLKLVLPETQTTVLLEFADLEKAGAVVEGAPVAAAELGNWVQRAWLEMGARQVCGVLYRQGQRHVCEAREVQPKVGRLPIRRGGTCLITGGAGGLGLVFAEHLARKHAAKLVLIGRSALDETRQRQLQALEAIGSEVMYIQADVGDLASMRSAVKQAGDRFGAIEGVLHAAGQIDDRGIMDKTAAEFRQALRPKIDGTLVLEEVLADQPLGFVCYFSSSSAVLGDFGMCDYAVGNRFLMAYARARNRRIALGLATGRTVAIGWPLWNDGGMQVGGQDQTQAYLHASGQRALQVPEGTELFDTLISQPAAQVLVMAGLRERVKRMLGMGPAAADLARAKSVGLVDKKNLALNEDPNMNMPSSNEPGRGRRPEMRGLTAEQCVLWDLKDHASRLLNMARDQLDAEENFDQFGFDSVSLTRLAQVLNKHFGIDLKPVVFFSAPSLAQLRDHLVRTYPAKIEALYPPASQARARPVPAQRLERQAAPLALTAVSSARANAAVAASPEDPIAIIGMSGRFAGARTVSELWEILREGRDMADEVPADRFDWREIHGDPAKEPGKTNGKWLAAVPGVDEFDPLFFELSPREAEVTDPRQRLLLQEAWRALEDAGYGR